VDCVRPRRAKRLTECEGLQQPSTDRAETMMAHLVMISDLLEGYTRGTNW
jgi:hypothetical protein